jgi:hypothetical protein
MEWGLAKVREMRALSSRRLLGGARIYAYLLAAVLVLRKWRVVILYSMVPATVVQHHGGTRAVFLIIKP